MGAPNVTVREIDLSTRVPSFPGVYGALVVEAKRGPLEPTLVTSDKEFLKKFTPNELIDIGYSDAHWSALAFLQGSDKLWVNRAHNAALYGGVAMQKASSATANAAWSAGVADPTVHSFGPDEGFTIYGDSPGAWSDAIGIKVWNYHTTENLNAAAFNIDTNILTTTQDWGTGVDVIFRPISNGTLPSSLALNTVYYCIRASATTVKLASSLANAIAGTSLTFGTAGTGIVQMQPAVEHCKEPPQTIDAATAYAFQVEVYKNNSLVETWTCSKNSKFMDGYGNNIYVDNILLRSEYIRGLANALVSEGRPKDQPQILLFDGGSDGSAVADSNRISALNAMLNTDAYPITIVMDGNANTSPYAYQKEIATFCLTRKDCFGILGTPTSLELGASYMNDLISYRKIDLNLGTSTDGSDRVALYSPSPYIYDKFMDRYIYVGADGYAGAVISKTAANYELWYPPAGFRRGGLANVLGVSRKFTYGEMDLLYDAGINPIRFAPGRGILFWGQKTLLARPSALDRINVRLLLIVIEPAIRFALEDFVFEFNDAPTRALVRSMIISYMDDIKARKGVLDYLVVCDSTNNTSADIDNHKLNVNLFIKPMLSVEYITFTVVITRTGMDFKEAAAAIGK